MSQVEAEKLNRSIQQMQKYVKDINTAANGIGTPKDTAQHRERIKKLRQAVTALQPKIEEGLKGAAFQGIEELQTNYQQAKKDLDAANLAVARKEKQFPLGSPASVEAGGGGGGAESTSSSAPVDAEKVKMHDFKRVDMSELQTEETFQNEKLQGALEIEGEMRDLHSTYQDFETLVKTQQTGIDKMQTDVQQAKVHVEKGVVELQGANKEQKSSRKKLCILLVVVVVILVLVGVIIVVTQKLG